MGLRGPRPTPTNLLALRGSWRGNRGKDEPQAPAGTPDAPDALTPAERGMFEQLAGQLSTLGVLTAIDGVALAGLARWIVMYDECWEKARAEGAVVKVNGQPVPNPWLSAAHKAWAEVRKAAAEFGLTPSARGRLTIEPPKKANPLDKYLMNPQYHGEDDDADADDLDAFNATPHPTLRIDRRQFDPATGRMTVDADGNPVSAREAAGQ